MTMTLEDRRLLAELCEQHDVSADKVLKLLDTVRDYEFKDRRTGVYDALREILKSTPASTATRAVCSSSRQLADIRDLIHQIAQRL